MKVIIRAKADDDIDHIFAWIAQDNPSAATDMVARIRERINRLATEELTYMGHAGSVAGRSKSSCGPTSSSTKYSRSAARL